LVFGPLLHRFFRTRLHFGFNAAVATDMLIDLLLNVNTSYSRSPPKTLIINTQPPSFKSSRLFVTSALTHTLLATLHCPSANLINVLLTLVHKLLSLFAVFYQWRGYVKIATVLSLCKCRSRWPSGLRHVLSSLSRKLGSCVRIPLWAWMFGVGVCAFLSLCTGSGLATS
jgi:hypothetical protein